MTDKKYLDTLFSEFIRKRAISVKGGCEKCGSQKYDTTKENGEIFKAFKYLQCSHFYGKRKHSVRWDEDNGIGLCGSCHLYFTSNPNEHVEWQKEHLGGRFDDLYIRANKPHKPDISLLIIYYQEKLKEV